MSDKTEFEKAQEANERMWQSIEDLFKKIEDGVNKLEEVLKETVKDSTKEKTQ